MRFTRDRRPPIEQAKSGLRIVGAMVASVTVVGLCGLAYVQIANADHARNPRAGWLLMITVAVTLGLTTKFWRRWFFFLPTYLGVRSSLGLLLGWFSPRGFVFIAFPVLMFAMAAMSSRFSELPKVRAFDRAILLITAGCLLAATLEFLAEPNAMALLFAGLGDVALFASRLYPARAPRQRAAKDSSPLTLHR